MGRYIQQPPMRSAFAPRRFLVLGLVAFIFLFILFVGSFRDSQPSPAILKNVGKEQSKFDSPGTAIAPKLGNETAKYVLHHPFNLHI